MRIVRYSIALSGLLCIALTAAATAQEIPTEFTREPAEARFVYDDVVNFNRAFAMLASSADSLDVIQAEYIDKGTPGLKVFQEKYGLTAEGLLKAIRKRPEKYTALKDMPAALHELEDSTRAAFERLKQLIPEAVFLPTYFLVETHRGIGSGSVEGPLIAVDRWEQPLFDKTTMIVHEVTHIQQVVAVGYDKYVALFGPEKNLLGLCIREGTAEFFADLVTGDITQDEALPYTIEHESRLWEQFVKEMHGSETGDWMWSKPADSTQPPHVGYVMGYRIVQSYYERAEDTARAVTDILSVTDYPKFLEQSGYGELFAEEE
jgi:hypothetical protein